MERDQQDMIVGRKPHHAGAQQRSGRERERPLGLVA